MELNAERKSDRYKPKAFRTYLDENAIGSVKNIAKR